MKNSVILLLLCCLSTATAFFPVPLIHAALVMVVKKTMQIKGERDAKQSALDRRNLGKMSTDQIGQLDSGLLRIVEPFDFYPLADLIDAELKGIFEGTKGKKGILGVGAVPPKPLTEDDMKAFLAKSIVANGAEAKTAHILFQLTTCTFGDCERTAVEIFTRLLDRYRLVEQMKQEGNFNAQVGEWNEHLSKLIAELDPFSVRLNADYQETWKSIKAASTVPLTL